MTYKTYEVRVFSDGTKFWYLNGQLHREDGPAYEGSDGTKSWYLNGQRHREDGPAVERSNGTKEWWLNDQRHREDGPAIEWGDGTKEWWLNGQYMTEQDFLARKNTCAGKIVEIDGKKYRLEEITQ